MKTDRHAQPIKLCLLPDFREEAWPSMDLCAERLLQHLPERSGWIIESKCPRYQHGFGAIPNLGNRKPLKNLDRLMNRWWQYPRFVRDHCQGFDLFHVVDHSYAHLVHRLPADRTGVFCHDLDAFRCLTQPELEPRPWWFRRLAGRILSGLRKAAVVFYSTEAVRSDIVRYGLLATDKLVHAPYGVDAAFRGGDPTAAWPKELEALDGVPWLLHVGTTIPRKRIDVLLSVFAAAREKIPSLRLAKVGGTWTADQKSQIEGNDLGRSIVHLGKVSQASLVQAYQRTAAVLITSDAEGFGLPMIEAMACGAPVIASDIPVLRESGGAAANFVPVGDVAAWVEAVMPMVRNDTADSARDARVAWAARYSWQEHARIIADAYKNLL